VNAKEGMRRFSLTLGIIGACAGICYSYIQLDSLRNQRDGQREFESLISSTPIQKLVTSLKSTGPAPAAGRIIEKYGAKYLWNEANQVYELLSSPDGYYELVGDIKDKSIRRIHFDETGRIDRIEKWNGETAYKTAAPSLGSYLIVPVFPLIGFLVPWGTIKTITWVVAGFFADTRKGP